MATPLGTNFTTEDEVVAQADLKLLGSEVESLVVEFDQKKYEKLLSTGSISPKSLRRLRQVSSSKDNQVDGQVLGKRREVCVSSPRRETDLPSARREVHDPAAKGEARVSTSRRELDVSTSRRKSEASASRSELGFDQTLKARRKAEHQRRRRARIARAKRENNEEISIPEERGEPHLFEGEREF